ncbi:ABC transporter substrate-binding protein [Pseudalkalibacillus berkeleyi]|uniref:ABC transporter substrate-binding protein n=1 Tax=Pseudalkalibacillus berkeleyi TaxID=1069813 RepID=A0ABS9H0Q9_9BACL|nr:ABC transporter substrate-binding protein [Pseudalkalibacillus berkeleyi]MCF6137420.1 ABC transporter substrate-binding protein [Pseudalkalibacillus berkeleyi]
MKSKLTMIILTLMIILAACGDKDPQSKESLNKDWNQIEKDANGSTVNLFMWGGDNGINRYIDEWVTPKLKEKHNITLKRHPMNTNEFIQKLQTEKKAGKDRGTIDIIWINGENFKNAKENELLLGSFASKLPNNQEFIDQDKAFIKTDMGTKIDGMEAPWGNVQFVMWYDAKKVQSPPRNFEELNSFLKKNPGTFTYPNPKDFSGNAFLRHLLYEKTDKNPKLNETSDPSWLDERDEAFWSYLQEITPNLWRNGETYPESLSQLDQMYSKGEVWFTFGFNEARGEGLIKDGVFPKSTKSYVLDVGSIGNTHYLSIPFNSPNPDGAMTAINFMESPEAQLAKMDPSMWGEGMVLDLESLPSEFQEKTEALDRGDTVLSTQTLEDAYLPELDSNYIDWIKENWLDEVVQK